MHHEVEYSVNISIEARSLDIEGPSFKMSLTMMGEEEVDAEVRRKEEMHKRSYRIQERVESFLAF